MTIRVVFTEECSWRYEILCDYCHRPITNLGLGLVIWPDRGLDIAKPGDSALASVLHKGVCDQSTTGRYAGHAPWMELTEVLKQFGEPHVGLKQIEALQ